MSNNTTRLNDSLAKVSALVGRMTQAAQAQDWESACEAVDTLVDATDDLVVIFSLLAEGVE